MADGPSFCARPKVNEAGPACSAPELHDDVAPDECVAESGGADAGLSSPYSMQALYANTAAYTNLSNALELPTTGTITMGTFRGATSATKITFPSVTSALTNWVVPVTIPYKSIYSTNFKTCASWTAHPRRP